jgi:hypothetical protein
MGNEWFESVAVAQRRAKKGCRNRCIGQWLPVRRRA